MHNLLAKALNCKLIDLMRMHMSLTGATARGQPKQAQVALPSTAPSDALHTGACVFVCVLCEHVRASLRMSVIDL